MTTQHLIVQKLTELFFPPRAEWSNSPHLLHIQEDECRLWRLLTCRRILEVRLLCHCKWVRKRKHLNGKWSFLLWQFDFVLYGVGRTLDWFRVSSGFIPSPQRDTYNHKNWKEYKREAVRCNLWPLNWSLEMGHKAQYKRGHWNGQTRRRFGVCVPVTLITLSDNYRGRPRTLIAAQRAGFVVPSIYLLYSPRSESITFLLPCQGRSNAFKTIKIVINHGHLHVFSFFHFQLWCKDSYVPHCPRPVPRCSTLHLSEILYFRLTIPHCQ